MDPKPLAMEVVLGFWGVWGGTPRGVWGPRLAESRDPGPPVPVREATLPIFLENRPKHTFLALLGVWGVPPRGSGAPGWQNPGTRGLLCRSERRPCQFFSKTGQNTRFWQFWGSEGYPQRGSGAPAWQNPGPRGLLGQSEGAIFPTTGRIQGRSEGGVPAKHSSFAGLAVWDPRLADSRTRDLLGRSKKAISSKKRASTPFP